MHPSTICHNDFHCRVFPSKSNNNQFDSFIFKDKKTEVIEVCYSSVVMELHKAVNYSPVQHLFGSPGNIFIVVFSYVML